MDRFIVEDEFAIPGKHWKYRTFHASDGRIISIRFRIDCDHYYHSDDCATFCRERNDTFGHYSCESKNGHKQCLYGWKGENCDKRMFCLIVCFQRRKYFQIFKKTLPFFFV